MFDTETSWFIRCDTCPDWPVSRTDLFDIKRVGEDAARTSGWEIRDGLHRCWECVDLGRRERVT